MCNAAKGSLPDEVSMGLPVASGGSDSGVGCVWWKYHYCHAQSDYCSNYRSNDGSNSYAYPGDHADTGRYCEGEDRRG